MARRFGGTTDIGPQTNYIILPSRVKFPTPLSFSVFARPENTTSGANQAIITSASAGDLNVVYKTSGGFEIGSMFVAGLLTTSGTSPTGSWAHVGGTYDGTNVAMFLNGAKNTGTDATGVTTSGPAQIGASSNVTIATANNPFSGAIHDVAVWGTILSDAEMRALAFGFLRPWQVRPGLLRGYWPLDGYEHPCLDLSIGRNLGVVTGTTLYPSPTKLAATPIFDMVKFVTTAPRIVVPQPPPPILMAQILM
jgi:Concanavalin A-like lectin/glucanases superfamily